MALFPATQDPAAVGEVIGSYRLESVLGRGGMGCVYRATHVVLERPAAIKVLADRYTESDEYLSRFFQEAKVVNAIRHPGIVDIIDFIDSVEPRRVAYVMELLEGEPLLDALCSNGLEARQSFQICVQLASVLEAVHAIGVVHRDLKPANVFLASGEATFERPGSVKVLDFGIAKFAAGSVEHQTASGVALGTPSYMAPEQITAHEVSPATDMYALGELLCEMLSGRKLFGGATSEVLMQKLTGQLPPFRLPASLAARSEVEGLIRACLATSPSDRPSLRQFSAGLKVILPAFRGESAPGRTRSSWEPTEPNAFDPTPSTSPVTAPNAGNEAPRLEILEPPESNAGPAVRAATSLTAALKEGLGDPVAPVLPEHLPRRILPDERAPKESRPLRRIWNRVARAFRR